MKVKQPRRWKKHTVQKQGEISNRFSGRILWAMLLLGGIGTLIALGIPAAAEHLRTRPAPYQIPLFKRWMKS